MESNSAAADSVNDNDENDNVSTAVAKPSRPKEALSNCFSLLQDALTSATSSGRTQAVWSQSSPQSPQYRSELQLLKTHLQPIYWGVGCSLLSFAAFRFGGSFRLVRKSKSSHNNHPGSGYDGIFIWSGYQFQKIPSNVSHEAGKEQAMGRLLTLPVDLALSTLIGCSAAAFLTDAERLRRDMSKVPLVQGKSFVSQELCPLFEQEYNRWDGAMWTNDKILEANPAIGSVHEFVVNCRKRTEFETLLREKRLVDSSMVASDNESNIAIPSPGIPENIDNWLEGDALDVREQ